MKSKILALQSILYILNIFVAFSQKYDVDVENIVEITTYKMPSRNNPDATLMQFLENRKYNDECLKQQKEFQISFFKIKFKKTKEINDLLALASRLNLRQETIATLNRIETPKDDLDGVVLVVPDMNGIFIPESPELSYEIILRERITTESKNQKDSKKNIFSAPVSVVVTGKKNSQNFKFYIDGRLESAERAYFFDSGMKLPLEKSVISSAYGFRTSPISGRWLFHNGIDLAAPAGSSVFSCKNGIVQQIGYSEIYGNYIIIAHDGDKRSLYAHLSKTLVQRGDIISGGKKIGEVGTTGLSTGPHLHFEFSENGKTKNPQELLKF